MASSGHRVKREKGSDRARAAWLNLLRAYVRAARTHIKAPEVQARAGDPGRAEAALARAEDERRGYDRALALHPEWTDQAPEWPLL
jgi:hypothetical protein